MSKITLAKDIDSRLDRLKKAMTVGLVLRCFDGMNKLFTGIHPNAIAKVLRNKYERGVNRVGTSKKDIFTAWMQQRVSGEGPCGRGLANVKVEDVYKDVIEKL